MGRRRRQQRRRAAHRSRTARPRPILRVRLRNGTHSGVDAPVDHGMDHGMDHEVVDPYRQIPLFLVLSMCYATISLFLLIIGVVMEVTGLIIAGGVASLLCLAAILTLLVVWRNSKFREIHAGSERGNDTKADQGPLVVAPPIHREQTVNVMAHPHAATISDGRLKPFVFAATVRETSQADEFLEPVRYELPAPISGANFHTNFTTLPGPDVPHSRSEMNGFVATSQDQVHFVPTLNMPSMY